MASAILAELIEWASMAVALVGYAFGLAFGAFIAGFSVRLGWLVAEATWFGDPDDPDDGEREDLPERVKVVELEVRGHVAA